MEVILGYMAGVIIVGYFAKKCLGKYHDIIFGLRSKQLDTDKVEPWEPPEMFPNKYYDPVDPYQPTQLHSSRDDKEDKSMTFPL